MTSKLNNSQNSIETNLQNLPTYNTLFYPPKISRQNGGYVDNHNCLAVEDLLALKPLIGAYSPRSRRKKSYIFLILSFHEYWATGRRYAQRDSEEFSYAKNIFFLGRSILRRRRLSSACLILNSFFASHIPHAAFSSPAQHLLKLWFLHRLSRNQLTDFATDITPPSLHVVFIHTVWADPSITIPLSLLINSKINKIFLHNLL